MRLRTRAGAALALGAIAALPAQPAFAGTREMKVDWDQVWDDSDD